MGANIPQREKPTYIITIIVSTALFYCVISPAFARNVTVPCQSNAPNQSNSGVVTHIYANSCNNDVTNEASGTVTGTVGGTDPDAPVLIDTNGGINVFKNKGTIGQGSITKGFINKGKIGKYTNEGTITTNNNNTLTNSTGVQNYNFIDTFENYGLIQTGTGNSSHAIENVGATVFVVTNYDRIYGSTGGDLGVGIDNKDSSYIQIFNNYGQIYGSTGAGADNVAILNKNYSRIDYFNNYGTLTPGFGTSNVAISNEDHSRIEYFNNYGTVTTGNGSSNVAIYNSIGSQITTITNYGTMSVGSGSNSTVIKNDGYIVQIYNLGQMNTGVDAASASIKNNGTIQTFANSQMFGSGYSKVVYSGNLPIFYQIAITDGTYGQTQFVNSNNTVTTFGVYEGSHPKAKTEYKNVVTGLTATNFGQSATTTSFKGKFKGQTWTLTLAPGTNDVWNLSFSLDWINTYLTMQSNRDAVRGALQQRYAVISTVLDYDCKDFDKYGICLSFQSRSTGFGSQSTGAGVLTASYRVADKFRVGAFLDYQVWQNNPSGAYYGTGGLKSGYDNATFGGFAGYADHNDGTGLKVRVSGAYNPGTVIITRALLDNTEAGSGAAGLYGSGVYGEAGWGFGLGNFLVVTPYFGIRYIDTTRNAYSESANAIVQFPIAYNEFYERVVTGTAFGVASGKLIDSLGYRLGGGVEFDFNRFANSYSGVSLIPDLETFAIANGGVWNAVRPAGLAGVTYDVAPRQQLFATTIVREQPYSTRAYMSGLLGYQIAF